jgi:hypothetical protein
MVALGVSAKGRKDTTIVQNQPKIAYLCAKTSCGPTRACDPTALRRLMRNPFGGFCAYSCVPLCSIAQFAVF